MSSKITIVSGTNRPDSVSIQIAKFYQQKLRERNHESIIIDLKELPEDYIISALYDNAGTHSSFNAIRDVMANTEKMIFIVPEYNGSFPGVLKAFIDGLKFPQTFKGKKGALVGISSGIQGGVLALSHLTDILNYCGMHVLAQKPKLYKIEDHFVDGILKNAQFEKHINLQLDQFLAF